MTDVDRDLAHLLGVVADNKHLLGRWLSEWAVGAPGLENAVAAAGIAQGHLGQARALAAPDRERTHHLAALGAPFETWAQCVATLYLVDPALDVVLRAVRPPQADLGRRVARVLEESRFNSTFAHGRVLELTERWDAGRAMLAPALQAVMPEVLCWFGPPQERGVQALVGAGALALDGDGMRAAFLDHVAPTLLACGYDVGVKGDPGAWTHEELPWPSWDPTRRRLTTTA